VDPILDRRVRVLYPAAQVVETRRFNGAGKPVVRVAGDTRDVSLDAHLVPATRSEGDYPNWYTPFAMVQVSPRRSWGDVARWAVALYPEPGALPADLAARVEAWRKIEDPRARAFAVLRALQAEVRYFGAELGDSTHRPSPPAETWTRRYGDCKDKTYLAVTLLRQLGIEAEPALVSASTGRAVGERLPSAELFDHVIVRARIGGKSYWLDPTLSEQHGSLDTLPVRSYGLALPVIAGADALVPVEGPAKPDNGTLLSERIAPAVDGRSIELTVSTVYTGLRAERVRARVSAQGTSEISRAYTEFYRKRYGNLSVRTPLTITDAKDEDRLELVESYVIQDGWTSRDGQTRGLQLHADGLGDDADLPSTVERTGPLALGQPATLRHETTLALPAGWALVDPPAAAKVSAAGIEYRREIAGGPGDTRIHHQLDVTRPHLEVAQVGDHVRGLREVRDLMGTRVYLRMPSERADDERRDRLRKLLRETSGTDDKGT
jgi:hypothetical protein